MAVSNRERVARALEIAAEALGPFVAKQLAPTCPREQSGRLSFACLTRRKDTTRQDFFTPLQTCRCNSA